MKIFLIVLSVVVLLVIFVGYMYSRYFFYNSPSFNKPDDFKLSLVDKLVFPIFDMFWKE